MAVGDRSGLPKPFSKMTEEEKIAWAKSYKQPAYKPRTNHRVVLLKKKAAKFKAYKAEEIKKRYHNPEKKKISWGNDYNDRRRYIYQYNEEFREQRKLLSRFKAFQKQRTKYQAWLDLYYYQYRKDMINRSQTFKLGNSDYFVAGFTEAELAKYMPISKGLNESLKTANVFPPPAYQGYRFLAKRLSEEPEGFYLVEEVEVILNIFARYKKKFNTVNTEEQKAFLKKEFWTKLRKIRKDFDQEN